MEKFGQEKIDLLKAKFRKCFSNKEYKYCTELLGQIIPISKGNDKINATLMLGICHFKLGYYEEGKNAFEKIRNVYPSSAVFFPLGQCYFALGMYDEAQNCLEETIKIDPNVPAYIEGLGNFYLAVDKKDKALEMYYKLKELDVELANNLYNSILDSDPENTLGLA